MKDHGNALGDHDRGHEVPHLPGPQLANLWVVGLSFDAAVPAKVVIGAVAVLLAVGLVVLLVVADEIREGEAVVRGDEVDARVRHATGVCVEVAAAGEAVG